VARDVMQSVNSTAPYALDTGGGQFAVAASGALAFVAGGPQRDAEGELQWIGRDGRVEPIPVPPPARAYFLPRISPDGRFIAVGTLGLRDQNLWKYDIAQGTLARLTFEGRTEQAVWSPDGSRIAFASTIKGAQNLYLARSDAGAPPEPLTSGPTLQFPGSWTPDSRQLVLTNGGDIAVLALDGTRTPKPLIATPFVERMPALSPSGRWLAYVSNETGRAEVYVRGFPDTDSKTAISVDGGTQPVWGRDGRHLFYLASASRGAMRVARMIEVDVATDGVFGVRSRRQLFELDAIHYGNAAQASSYDATADNQRFVFVRESFRPEAVPRGIEVVSQWLDDLKRRAPR
jgi:eukaryotic-like serine/threonine-protein kinase